MVMRHRVVCCGELYIVWCDVVLERWDEASRVEW